MTGARRTAALALGLGFALALVLGGCGRKAPNLPPADSTYPRTYPAPTTPEAAPPASTLPAPTLRDERRRRTGPSS
ncbi:hypothetical protein [Roseospira goensis]|uniref:Putative small lipoprotein YifL n=1 Tax=Roseospira goensis TaxID=391922 RepID=A0A7W6WJG7_9PROT|nr:hypothetical protein [Roseospira goensis]MBB4285000.1 putative small lipoprotein YifL [Roseospira goensis]